MVQLSRPSNMGNMGGGSSGSGGLQITCQNCGTPFAVQLEQIIDATRNPSAKARFLAGRTNVFACPNCGYQSRVGTPLLYHDQSKELLMLYVPMELNLPKPEQERLIGSMTQALINSIPQEQRKGYLFTPRQALTLQGMMETILEADGITKEMVEAQRQKVRIVETYLQTDPDQWDALTEQFGDQIDRQFFDIITASAEAAAASGRRDVTEAMLVLRDRLLQSTKAGQEMLSAAQEQEARIQSVADELNALGKDLTHDQVVDLAIRLGKEGDEKLQVLVGLARPLMDYHFFELLAQRLEAAEGEDAEQITAIRDRLLELTTLIDQSNQAVVQQAANTLNEIMNAQDVDAAIDEHLAQIDDLFLQVLSANIQHAEQQGDQITGARLKNILQKVMALLEQSAPPAIQFINQLLGMQTLDMAKQELAARAEEFGPDLLDWFDSLDENLAASGDQQMRQTLSQLRAIAAQVLGSDGDTDGEESSETNSGIILPFSTRKRKE
ncbi:MAG: CpXC domain-containing protein [Anaerolineae bacterium]